MKKKNVSDEVNVSVDCLIRARFMLEGEKMGPNRVLVFRAANYLDKVIESLQKMRKDLRNIGL